MTKIVFKESLVIIFSSDIKKVDYLTMVTDSLLHKPKIVYAGDITSLKAHIKSRSKKLKSEGILLVDSIQYKEKKEDLQLLLKDKTFPTIFMVGEEDTLPAPSEFCYKLIDDVKIMQFKQVILCLRGFIKSMNKGEILATEGEFQSIRTNYLLRFNKTQADIYIRIGEKKFIKLLNKNDYYDADKIKYYQNQNLDYLYMKKDDLNKFSNDMRLLPYLNFEKPTNISYMEFSQLKASHILNLCKDMFSRNSSAPQVNEIVAMYVTEVEQVAEKEKLLFKNLKKMKERSDYFTEHSYLIGFTVSHMMKFLEETYRANKKKLIIASMFHDLLVESHKLVEIQNKRDPRCRIFKQHRLDKYFNHPLETSDMIMKARLFPKDVATIILEHHETPQGDGFPFQKNATSVSTLSAIFIVAHSFTELVFQGIFDEVHPEKALEILENKFQEGFYKTALEALKKAFIYNNDD